MADYTYVNPFNTVLHQPEMQQNSLYICDYYRSRNLMTVNAIAGMLGNFESESTINPNRVENTAISRWPNWGNYGYGLAQWTPWYTKQKNDGSWYDPANYHGTNSPTYGYWAEKKGYLPDASTGGTIGQMDIQLEYLNLGLGGWTNDSGYFKMRWSEFKASTWAASELAKVFYRNYERSASGSYGNRPANGTKWYNYLVENYKPGGGPPPGPEPGGPGAWVPKSSKFIYYMPGRWKTWR